MINRYLNRTIYKNNRNFYENVFLKRKIKFINQYETPEFYYPSKDQIKQIETIEHIWSVGDRYYKLAEEYYGDPRDWWIIAKFNNKPTEAHIKIGDVLLIPVPLQKIISIMRG